MQTLDIRQIDDEIVLYFGCQGMGVHYQQKIPPRWGWIRFWFWETTMMSRLWRCGRGEPVSFRVVRVFRG